MLVAGTAVVTKRASARPAPLEEEIACVQSAAASGAV
jgi:hypothetical protein